MSPAKYKQSETKCKMCKWQDSNSTGVTCELLSSCIFYQHKTKKGHLQSRCPFLCGFCRLEGRLTLRHLNARGQQSHPISALSVALRVAAIPNVATTAARNSQPIDWKFTRHSAHGQEGPLGGVSVNSPKTDNIHHFPRITTPIGAVILRPPWGIESFKRGGFALHRGRTYHCPAERRRIRRKACTI